MAKQYRGCSHLVYALVTESEGKTEYGTVKVLAPVKSVSRDIDSSHENVWADNAIQETHFSGTKVTRSFDCTRLGADVEAELLGLTVVTIGGGKAYATDPDGANRPYIAVGYALHDGDAENPCEVVWAYHGKVLSISKASNTIDDGTGSEGQTVEIEFSAPVHTFTATGKRNLDLCSEVNAQVTVAKWFAQVVTPDNASTLFTA
jgi:phi13 family phage major tail protein